MLDNLKRFFKAPEGITQEEVDMTVKEGQPELVVDNKTAELSAQLESASMQLASANDTIAKLSTELNAVKESFAAVQKEKAEAMAQAASDKAQARREKVEAALGTTKADEVLAATKDLDDAAFESIVGAFALSFDKEANSPTFKEKGVTASTEVDVKPTHFKKYIK